jgi:hypothetical protein
VNRAYEYQIVATDPEGKPVTFTKVSGPSALTFLGAGEVSWVPVLADVGTHAVSVSVSDGKAAVLHDWMITVAQPGDGGMADAGTVGMDGGTTMPPATPKGCGCSSGGGVFALIALARLLRTASRR